MEINKEQTKEFDINFLNGLIPNMQGHYDFLSEKKGLYLPDIGSKAITYPYMQNVQNGQVYTVKRAEIKFPFFKKKTRKLVSMMP